MRSFIKAALVENAHWQMLTGFYSVFKFDLSLFVFTFSCDCTYTIKAIKAERPNAQSFTPEALEMLFFMTVPLFGDVECLFT